MQKICHVITRMIIGGAQENTLFTCRGQIEDGMEVTLVTGPSTGPEGTLLDKQPIEGLKVVEIPEMLRQISPINDWKAYKKLRKFFREQKFDVVHTHASKAGIIARAAAWKEKIPCVIHTIHGLPFHPYESKLKNWIYITAEKFAAKRCHKILCVADAMAKQAYEAGVAPMDKFATVYSGMDLQEYFKEHHSDLRDKYNIPEDAIVIGKIARLFELKGHDFLIKAAEQVIAKCPKAIFLLIGDGLLKEEIEQEIKSKNMQDHFRFTGLIPPTEVPEHTSIMDILVHLSLREGLPRAVVQGLAASKPAVGYALDGTPEVIINDETGYICPAETIDEIAEVLIKLCESKELRERLGKNGRKLVEEKFSWRKMTDDINFYCKKILNS